VWGKLLVLALLAGGLVVAKYQIYPWLAVTSRVSGEYLVVEGWIHTSGFQQAASEFKRGEYRKILTSGCMAHEGARAQSGATYADWGAERIRELGISNDWVVPIPCWVDHKDRTYHSALAVKKWFQDNHLPVRRIDVVTLGPHARRTRLLFQEAFGGDVTVGVIATDDSSYDPLHWWRTSEGTREVLGEAIAYIYDRVFFYPSAAN
jgi:uncharacterized SAM-binding protein YcdF (DUF218 family)